MTSDGAIFGRGRCDHDWAEAVWDSVREEYKARQFNRIHLQRMIDPLNTNRIGWPELKSALEKFSLPKTGTKIVLSNEQAQVLLESLLHHCGVTDADDVDFDKFFKFLRFRPEHIDTSPQKPTAPGGYAKREAVVARKSVDGGRQGQPHHRGARSPERAPPSPIRQQRRELPVSQLLDPLIGMTEVKQQVQRFQKSLKLDERRQSLGHAVYAFKRPHMAFFGNPGTGKTSIAQIMGRILANLGYLTTGNVVEVQRSKLVAGVIGQTAIKTREVIESAKGGVLFIDEAYRLTPANSEKDFGKEAVDELMEGMNAGDPVMIFAGYNEEMHPFLNSNPGIFRRISKQFFFEDYTPQELAQIFLKNLEKRHFKCEAGLDEAWLTDLIGTNTKPEQRARMNGGLVDQLLEQAKEELDDRLNLDLDETSLNAIICTFQKEDLVKAINHLKDSWHKFEQMIAPA